jgi:phosphinothricin acetyltransferase
VGISLRADSRGQGLGSALYRALFEILDAEQVHVAVAGILQPNDASVALHRRFGFTDVGMFHEYAVKNGRHFSSPLLQRRR